MNKKAILIVIIVLIAAVTLVAYAFIPGAKPLIHDAGTSAYVFASGQFLAFSTWFQTLPYWPAIAIFGGFIVGILTWWKIDTIQHALHFWGYNKTTQPLYRDKPTEEPPRVIRPNPQTQAPIPPLEQKTEIAET